MDLGSYAIRAFQQDTNIFLPAREYYPKFAEMKSSLFLSIREEVFSFPCNTITTICGVPAIPVQDGVVLYVRCEWCGTKELPDIEKGICRKCGGYV